MRLKSYDSEKQTKTQENKSDQTRYFYPFGKHCKTKEFLVENVADIRHLARKPLEYTIRATYPKPYHDDPVDDADFINSTFRNM